MRLEIKNVSLVKKNTPSTGLESDVVTTIGLYFDFVLTANCGLAGLFITFFRSTPQSNRTHKVGVVFVQIMKVCLSRL